MPTEKFDPIKAAADPDHYGIPDPLPTNPEYYAAVCVAQWYSDFVIGMMQRGASEAIVKKHTGYIEGALRKHLGNAGFVNAGAAFLFLGIPIFDDARRKALVMDGMEERKAELLKALGKEDDPMFQKMADKAVKELIQEADRRTSNPNKRDGD